MTQRSPTRAIGTEFQHTSVTPRPTAYLVDAAVDQVDRHRAQIVSENVFTRAA